jgi:hypothetical protein
MSILGIAAEDDEAEQAVRGRRGGSGVHSGRQETGRRHRSGACRHCAHPEIDGAVYIEGLDAIQRLW